MSEQEPKAEIAADSPTAGETPATEPPSATAESAGETPAAEVAVASAKTPSAGAEPTGGAEAEAAEEEKEPPVRYELLEATLRAGSIVDVKFKVPAEEYNRKTEEYYKELRQTVIIEGFRRGKAPLKLLQNRYHKEVEKDALDYLFTNCLEQIVEEKKYAVLRELDRQNSGVEKDQDITFSVSLEIRPQIEPQGYDHFDLTVDAREVNEALVEAEIEKLRRRHATFQKTEMAPYAPGNGIVLDIRVTNENGEEIPELTRKAQFFAQPARSLPEEVEQQLRGKRAGDLLTVRVPYERKSEGGVITSSADIYHLKVCEVRREVLPEFNDEFARDVAGMSTAQELRERIRKELEENEEQRVREQALEKIFNQLIERNPFDVPESLREEMFRHLLSEYTRRLNRLGLRLEDLGDDPKEYALRTRQTAERTVRVLLLTRAIAEKEKIEPTEADIERAIAKQAEREGRRPLAVRARLEREKRLNEFIDDLKYDLVNDLLLSRASISKQFVLPESKLVTPGGTPVAS
ncbi:MAG: trigger factor [Candidatus Sumerlaeia bacterium]|nr:trigger factor [Candidatus Sumerlaeia bacterium]